MKGDRVLVCRFAAMIVLLIGMSSARAESRWGLGFTLGSPTALSLKHYLSEERALDLQVAFHHDDYVIIFGDYLYHFPGVWPGSEKFLRRLSPYVGVGPVLAFANDDDHDEGKYFDKRDDDFAIGVRVPFGIEWIWEKAPLGIGLEVAPGIIVAPSTIGLVQGGLTLRYYF